MQPIKVLLTACGCPGASTLIRMLRLAGRNDDRRVEIVGVDCDPDAIGSYLCDDFYVVPPVADEEYLSAMLKIAAVAGIDVILPESSLEIPALSKYKDSFLCPVLVSSENAVKSANSKLEMYRAIGRHREFCPRHILARAPYNFRQAVHNLGYPHKPVCFKPPIGKGSRGFRIIHPEVGRASQLLDHKPMARYISLEEMGEIFTATSFPELLVMEFVEGEEITADVLCLDGEALLIATKTNEEARWGVTQRGQLVDRPSLREIIKEVLKAIPLSYCVNFQFIGNKLIEINPRVSTFIYQEDLVFPYLAIKLALGEISPQQIKEKQKDIAIGRRFIRYMDQVFYD